MYTEPALIAPVSSKCAPTKTLLPSTDTKKPKKSSVAGVGLLKVCSKFPVVASNRYAEPALVAPVSSRCAPRRTLLPSTDTEVPKPSFVAGAGLLKVCSRFPVVASNRYAEPTLVTPVSSRRAPTRTLLPSTDTDWPKRSAVTGVGLLKVCSRFPVVASNMYTEPASVAPVSSFGAPRKTLLPSTDTEVPKRSAVAGVGLLKVCSRFPVVASNRYAEPALVASVSSWRAPMRTLLPSTDTDSPKKSNPAGVGLLKVCSKFPVVASNRYAEPALPPPASSKSAPTRTLLPSTDTEMPKKSSVAGVGLLKVWDKPLSTIIVVAPFDGTVTDDIESVSPSASESFDKTDMLIGVFSDVTELSSTATG